MNVHPMNPIPKRVCLSQITHFPSHAQIISLAQHLGKLPQKTVQSRIRALQVWDEARQHSPTGTIAETAACLLYTLKPSTVETYMAKVRAQRPELGRSQEFRKVFDDVIRLSNAIPKRRAFPLGPKQVKILMGNLSTPEQIMVYQLWTTAGRFDCRKNWAVTYHDEVKAVELRFGPRKGDKKGATPFAKFIPCNSAQEALRLWTIQGVPYSKFMAFLRQSGIPGISTHSFRNGANLVLERFFDEKDAATLTGHKVIVQRAPGMRSYRPIHPHSAQARMSRKIALLLQRALMQA